MDVVVFIKENFYSIFEYCFLSIVFFFFFLLEGIINREYFEGIVKVIWIWFYFGFFFIVEKCCNIDV